MLEFYITKCDYRILYIKINFLRNIAEHVLHASQNF